MRMSPLNVTSERSSAGHASEAHSGLGAAKLLFGQLRSRCKLYEGYELPMRIGGTLRSFSASRDGNERPVAHASSLILLEKYLAFCDPPVL